MHPLKDMSMKLTGFKKSVNTLRKLNPKKITKKKSKKKIPYHSEHVRSPLIPMQFWRQPESEGVEGGNICQLLAQRSHRLPL